jgi:hypothetical protein
MQHLTFEQALLDTVNFAKNVNLTFDTFGRTNTDRAVRNRPQEIVCPNNLTSIIAVGPSRWFIQWCPSRMDRSHLAWYVLGVPRLQCTCGSNLGLCMSFALAHAILTDPRQWQYFVPIQKHLPQNCSKDVEAAVEYIDSILLGPDEKAKQDLKNQFQLGSLRDDDFAE